MESLSPRERLTLAATAGAGGLLVAAGWLEARHLRPREEEVLLPAPGAPELRIAHLSDLHLGRLGRVHYDAAWVTNAFRPHLIAITGDLVNRRRGLAALHDFLRLLAPGPTLLAVPGNWDHGAGVVKWALPHVLERHEGRLLVNAHHRLEVEGRSVLITGLDDPVRGRADLGAALDGAPAADLHVLLVHAPAWRDRLEGEVASVARRRRCDLAAVRPHLLLSGHTHGGQVRLGPLAWTPQGSGRYLGGWYRGGGVPPMFVSNGVGALVPVRLGAPPEVGLFRVAACGGA